MKIKVTGNAIEDPEIKFVSLVKRGANREPFKIVKSEDSLRAKVAAIVKELFSSEKALVEKVEGSTVQSENTASDSQGDDMKAKITEAQSGDLDGLLIEKADSAAHMGDEKAPAKDAKGGMDEEGCKAAGGKWDNGACTMPDPVEKAADEALAKGAAEEASAVAAKAADDKAEEALAKTVAPLTATIKVVEGDKIIEKTFEYTLDADGKIVFQKYVDGDNTAGAASSSEIAMDPEQARILADTKAKEKADAATGGGALPGLAKIDAAPAVAPEVAALLKGVDAISQLLLANTKRLEDIEKAATAAKEAVKKSEGKRPSVVRVLDADLDETFATPGMAVGRRGIKKGEAGRDVWAGLIPDFDGLSSGDITRG